jgi:hypothetical protein
VLIWRKFDTYQLGTNFIAWAFQIAKNQVFSYIRDRGRDLHVFDDLLVKEMAMRSAEQGEPTSELSAFLARCLEECSDDQRKVLLERYSQGASVQEMDDMDYQTRSRQLDVCATGCLVMLLLAVAGCSCSGTSVTQDSSGGSESVVDEHIGDGHIGDGHIGDGAEQNRDGTNRNVASRLLVARSNPKSRSPQFHPSKFRAQYDVVLTVKQESQAEALFERVRRNLLTADANNTASIEKLTMRVAAPIERTTLIAKFAGTVPPSTSQRDLELLFLWEDDHWEFFSGFSLPEGGRSGQRSLSDDQIAMLLGE